MHKLITVDGNNYKYFYLILTSAKLLLYTPYEQFVKYNTSQYQKPKTNQDTKEHKNNNGEIGNPQTDIAKLYHKYREETSGDKADDMISKKLKREADFKNVLRQVLTARYAEEHEGAETNELVTLFSDATPKNERIKIIKNAKKIFGELVEDAYIKPIAHDQKKAERKFNDNVDQDDDFIHEAYIEKTIFDNQPDMINKMRRQILSTFFDEDVDDTKQRLVLSSCKISEELKRPIKDELQRLKVTEKLKEEKNVFKKLDIAYENKEVLKDFDKRVDELPYILTIPEKVTFILKECQNLEKKVDFDTKAKLKEVEKVILAEINIEELIAKLTL